MVLQLYLLHYISIYIWCWSISASYQTNRTWSRL